MIGDTPGKDYCRVVSMHVDSDASLDHEYTIPVEWLNGPIDTYGNTFKKVLILRCICGKEIEREVQDD